mmetsp:Transcript_17722/g.28696  ORF Transcript_17722/g.28696 Transcript_17722/m.28696 type:complete len:106 (+) Transcript_17722:100-417(+)
MGDYRTSLGCIDRCADGAVFSFALHSFSVVFSPFSSADVAFYGLLAEYRRLLSATIGYGNESNAANAATDTQGVESSSEQVRTVSLAAKKVKSIKEASSIISLPP